MTFGLGLTDATATLMANGMLGPAGVALYGLNTYLDSVKFASSSRLVSLTVDTGKAAVNAGASLVGVSPCLTPSEMARSWQGRGTYSGVDNWTDVTIRGGSYVWGGTPGQSHFYTTTSDIRSAGNDATVIFRSLQVGTSPEHPLYRSGMTMYFVPNNIDAAIATTLANPRYGPGGFTEFFINDYSELIPVLTLRLINLGGGN